MSEANVRIVQAAFAAFERGDMDALLALCDEDIAIAQPPDLPGIPGEQRGHSGVLEALAIWPQEWEDYRSELGRIVADRGDLVVVTARTRGRGKQSGVHVEMDFTFVITVRDEKIVEWRLSMREDQALEVAGLSE
jgi:ketosteroid isomerase-like protein